MEEAYTRIDAIDHGTLNRTGLASPFVQEFAYLQFRKLCELMAVACLLAHGDIQGAASMRKEWNADKIIKRLASLDPNFFPYLVDFDLNPPQGQHKGVIGREGGLTKEEMLKIYYECDNHLHVGSLTKLLKGKIPLRVHYPDITAKAQKFRSLIGSHSVFLSGGNKVFLCRFRGPQGMEISIANRVSEGPPRLAR